MELPIDAAHLLAEIACDIATTRDTAAASQRIVDLALRTLRCDVVTLRAADTAGRLRLQAASDLAIGQEYGRVQDEIRSGPVWGAMESASAVLTDDVTTDERWPEFGRRIGAFDPPLRAAMAFPLDVGDRARHGVLVCSAFQPGFFDENLTTLGRLFAAHAAISLDSVSASQRADNLARALESSRRIAAAVGIVMTTYRLPEAQAFDMLRAASQGLNRKLRDIADEVWLTGRVPDFTAGPGPS